MHFHVIAGILAATLAAAAPAADPTAAKAPIEQRGYAALFCGGLCAPLLENPPAYTACFAACVATGSEGFDPTKVEGLESAATQAA